MARREGEERGEEPAAGEGRGGVLPPEHWSVARKDANAEAMEYLRERSHAPGVAEGGGPRNHYCMSCNGVLPLEYDSRRPSTGEELRCPHCGAAVDARVRAMFNWVEIDQVPPSDLAALLPIALAVVAGLAALALLAVWAL